MRARFILPGIFLLACTFSSAHAQTKAVKIGVLNDQSGVYADDQGIGSMIAAQLAVEDFTSKSGMAVEVTTADHQNKVDIGTTIARACYLNKVFIASGAGTADLTGKACSPNTVHWTYDTWELGHSIAKAVFARGGNSWYFITADYTFGKDLEASASEEVTRLGGKVLGSARVPLGASDFSSFLLQAQSAKPKVIALANPGGALTKR